MWGWHKRCDPHKHDASTVGEFSLSTMTTKLHSSGLAHTSTAEISDHESQSSLMIASGSQHLHRKLRGKEVQLFAVGGAIGTCTSACR